MNTKCKCCILYTKYLSLGLLYFHFYRPQTKLREGNVFTPVCQPFCLGGAGVRPGETATEAGSTHPTGMYSCVLLLLGLKYLFT